MAEAEAVKTDALDMETTQVSINTEGALHDIAEDVIQPNNMLVWLRMVTGALSTSSSLPHARSTTGAR